MSKVITFSRVFPKYHPKAGQPTYFIEKILLPFYGCGFMGYEYASTLQDLNATLNGGEHKEALSLWSNFWDLTVGNQELTYKYHTIRSGNRWKVGDKFSPRVWSGKPYKSKQIVIAPDIEILNIYNIKIYKDNEVSINGMSYQHLLLCEKLAKNDGLSIADFASWFLPSLPFEGQVICWSDDVSYGIR